MFVADIKRVVEQVSRDKGIDRAVLISALEEALRSAARKKFGSKVDIEVQYNDESGEIEVFQFKDVVGTDEVIYLALGKNLWHGLGFRLMDHPITMCPPLLPILAGFFSLFTENLELGTSIVYVAFGGGMVVPYFYLARRIYGVRVARRASFFLAFFPGLLLSFYWGSMTEPLYTFLLVAALLFLHKGLTEGRGIDFCLAGVFLAFVYLTRSEGLLFFLVLFSFAVLTSAAKRCLFRKKTLRNLLLMALSWSLIASSGTSV